MKLIETNDAFEVSLLLMRNRYIANNCTIAADSPIFVLNAMLNLIFEDNQNLDDEKIAQIMYDKLGKKSNLSSLSELTEWVKERRLLTSHDFAKINVNRN